MKIEGAQTLLEVYPEDPRGFPSYLKEWQVPPYTRAHSGVITEGKFISNERLEQLLKETFEAGQNSAFVNYSEIAFNINSDEWLIMKFKNKK